ncbi:hypothetical protein HHI36_011519, partial [Cryptolaemus montrouzieri]
YNAAINWELPKIPISLLPTNIKTDQKSDHKKRVKRKGLPSNPFRLLDSRPHFQPLHLTKNLE